MIRLWIKNHSNEWKSISQLVLSLLRQVIKLQEVALAVQYQVKYKEYWTCTLACIKMVVPDLI